VRLPVGETRCPTCGSPGVPDPNLHAPGIGLLEEPAVVEQIESKGELHEWWLDEDVVESAPSRQTRTPDLIEDRLLKTVGILAAAGAVCAILGWLIGPLFLSPLMESITGTPVESAGDLRPMGATLGLLVGLFFGAGFGWVLQPER
jgi:hypothetical protein